MENKITELESASGMTIEQCIAYFNDKTKEEKDIIFLVQQAKERESNARLEAEKLINL